MATFDDETLSTGVYSYNSPNLVGNLYELQYYPVFYVIGKDKTIILKEASLDRVDVFLKSIIQHNNNLTIN